MYTYIAQSYRISISRWLFEGNQWLCLKYGTEYVVRQHIIIDIGGLFIEVTYCFYRFSFSCHRQSGRQQQHSIP